MLQDSVRLRCIRNKITCSKVGMHFTGEESPRVVADTRNRVFASQNEDQNVAEVFGATE